MAKPPVLKSVVRFGKGGKVEFINKCDKVLYTKDQLLARALKDTGMYIMKNGRLSLIDLYKGRYVKGRREVDRKGDFKLKYLRRPIEYWFKKKEKKLEVGFKYAAWYALPQELGENGYRQHGVLRNTVFNNILTIRTIWSAYLSWINAPDLDIEEEDDGE